MKNKIVSLILIVVIIIAGIGISNYLHKNRRHARRWHRKAMPVYVETKIAKSVNVHYKLEGFGIIEPIKSITATSDVSGKLIYVSPKFREGGFFKKGQVIAKVDETDYKYDLMKKKIALASLKEDLKIEKGKRLEAQKELEIASKMIRNIDKNYQYLILREPYIKKLEDSIKNAKIDIKLAERKLRKCTIKAPFDAYILKKYADIGTYVSPNGKIADLVFADGYYVKVYVPVTQLKWLNKLKKNKVFIELSGYEYKGKIISILPNVDEKGLLAGILVYIHSRKNQLAPLKINNYAKVEIYGKLLRGITRIPISALRENSHIWLYENGRLKIKKINVLFESPKYIYTFDIKQGKRVVISQIATPVENMELYISEKQNEQKNIKNKQKFNGRWHDKANKVFHK